MGEKADTNCTGGGSLWREHAGACHMFVFVSSVYSCWFAVSHASMFSLIVKSLGGVLIILYKVACASTIALIRAIRSAICHRAKGLLPGGISCSALIWTAGSYCGGFRLALAVVLAVLQIELNHWTGECMPPRSPGRLGERPLRAWRGTPARAGRRSCTSAPGTSKAGRLSRWEPAH